MKFGERINLHTHTARCKHASGRMEEYCRAARDAGVRVLGWSDHTPFPDARIAHIRMDWNEFPEYLTDLDDMRRKFPDLEIFTGVEIDFFPDLGRSFYEDHFNPERGVFYRIGGPHFNAPDLDRFAVFSHREVRRYVDSVLELMQTGLFDYIAHPDFFMARCLRWDSEVAALAAEMARAAKDLSIPLEINTNGLRKPPIDSADGRRPPYPYRPFWELMGEYGVRMVIGSDAHAPEDVWSQMEEAEALGAQCRLTPCNHELAEIIRKRAASVRQ